MGFITAEANASLLDITRRADEWIHAVATLSIERVQTVLAATLNPPTPGVSHWEFRDGKAVCVSGDPDLHPPLMSEETHELFQFIQGQTKRSYPKR